MLESKGMIQYEISNFSKPEYKCKHNMGYWLLKDYIGLGPGAHGRYQFNDEIYSTINYYSPTKWIEYLVIKNQKPIQSKKKLNNNEQLIDTLNMGLRLNRGLHVSKIPNKDPLKQLTKHGLIKNTKNDYITCTPKGRLLLNSVIEILLN
jgi:oxygen-independent coproporphyrinogen-3 oxidase